MKTNRNRRRFADHDKAIAFACRADGNRGIWDFTDDVWQPWIDYFMGLGNGICSHVRLMPNGNVILVRKLRAKFAKYSGRILSYQTV